MITATRPASRRPVGRGFVLMVLAVLAGVVAMHGLGPGPALAAAPSATAPHAMPMAPTAAAGPADCSHTTNSTGHVHHADATCAAAGVGAPYAPPAPAAALADADAPAARPTGAVGQPGGGRAPPDLAELQLLRI
ncbi:DUF6153 family protein [Streptomyces subrutilus]|uniref:DUF6153 family protein n=1 Tax=Streptomyces subrutilus TaxID=36818 RepID=UPI0033EF364B